MNSYIKTLSISFSLILISACGGGGAAAEVAENLVVVAMVIHNTAPTITNTTLNISVQENQTSAFTVTATDANGDSLTYSIAEMTLPL